MQHKKPIIRRALHLPYKELHKVDLLVEKCMYPISIPEEPLQSSQKASAAFERTLRNRRRMDALERVLKMQIALDFEGLNTDQSAKLAAVIAKNDHLHQKLPEPLPVKDSHIHPSNSPGLSSHQEAFFDESKIAELVAEYYAREEGDAKPDDEFPVDPIPHGYTTEEDKRSPKTKDIMPKRNPNSFHFTSNMTFSRMSIGDYVDEHVERSNRQRYSKWADAAPNLTSMEIISQSTEEEKRMEAAAFHTMKAVTEDLHRWVHERLDAPIDFEEASYLLADRAADDVNADIEDVDVAGLDVLLNASKPSVMEAKPLTKINVVKESSPSDELVASLQNTVLKSGSLTGLGSPVRVHTTAVVDHTGRAGTTNPSSSSSSSKPSKKSMKDMEQGFTFKVPRRGERVDYGRWYVQPKDWYEFMINKGEDAEKRKQEAAKNRKFGGLMQKKLDEIEAKRRSEAAEAAEKRLRKSKPGKMPANEVVQNATTPLSTIVMAKK